MQRPTFASRAAAGALLAIAATLVGCGGGDQISDFRANRLRAFGDESSVINADGRKYTVNALKTGTSAVDCLANPIWVQEVARSYGLVFAQCNPTGAAAPSALILAAAGAKAGDVKTQIDGYLAADRFSDRDIVTVYAGANDVIELYRQFPAQGVDALVAAAEARGLVLAEQVNRIAATGARVIVATVIRQGQTPFGLAEKARSSDRDRAELLTRLSDRFNARMRFGLNNDGRKIALVVLDERISGIVSRPGDLSFVNATQAACLPSAPLPDCTTQTLTTTSSGTAADGKTWLWADDQHLSAGGQFRFGEMAVASANNNPF